MAGEIPDLIALERTGTGKGAARQARREGYVPGIVYGGGKDPLPINLPFNPLLTSLRKGRFLSTLFNMKVDGHEDVRVICRGVQRDVVKDLPTHVDFMRLRRTTKINLFIHVDITDREKSPGLRKGGVLNMVRPEVELIVTAGEIPDHLTASVAGMDFGDTLTISSITLPEGARPVIDRDFVICNIQAPSAITAAEEEGEEAEADIAADEVPTTSDEDEAEETEE